MPRFRWDPAGEAQLRSYAKAHSFVFMISICMDILRGKNSADVWVSEFGFYFHRTVCGFVILS